jgi:MFS family permease
MGPRRLQLALAGLIMTGATPADRAGRRRVFAAGLAVFTLASGTCAAAGEPLVLNLARLFRARQRAPARNVDPGARRRLPRRAPCRRGGCVGGDRWACAGRRTARRRPDHRWLGWRWIFLVNVPLGCAALAVVRQVMEESFGPRRPFDPLGLGLLTLGLVALVFGTVCGGAEGWDAPVILASFALGVVAIAAFVVAAPHDRTCGRVC